jgi:Zn-dependent protease with chaperone function
MARAFPIEPAFALDCIALMMTFLMHGATWAGLAALSIRSGRASPSTECSIWRLALFGPFLTSALAILLPSALAAVHDAPLLRAGAPAGAWETWLGGSFWAWIAAGWIFSLGLGLLRALHAVLSVSQTLRDRSACTDARVTSRLQRLLERARVTRVRLTQSARIQSPLGIGVAEICVPHSLLESLSDAEVDAVLAHELAHIERRDGLWFPAVAVAEAVLWLHPLNRWLAGRLRHCAELACDDRAVELVGQPHALARALARVAENTLLSPRSVLLPSMARAPSSLFLRMKRLVGTGTTPPSIEPRRLRWAVAFLVAVGGASSAFRVEASVAALPRGPAGRVVGATASARDEQRIQAEIDGLLGSEQSVDPETPRLLELQQELRHARAMQSFTEARAPHAP